MMRFPRDNPSLGNLAFHLDNLQSHPDRDIAALARQALQEMSRPDGSPEVLWVLHDALLEAGYDQGDPVTRHVVRGAANSVVATDQALHGSLSPDLWHYTMRDRPEAKAGGIYDDYGPSSRTNRLAMDYPLEGNFTDKSLGAGPSQFSHKGTPKKMAGLHSPQGGVLVRGIHYKPGQFIPSAETDSKAGHDSWKSIQEQRAKFSRSDGSTDTEALMAYRREASRPPKKVKKSRQQMTDAPPPPAGPGPVPGHNTPTLGGAPPAPRRQPRQDRLAALIGDSRQVGGRLQSQRREFPDYDAAFQGAQRAGAPEGLIQAAAEGDYLALRALLDWYEETGGQGLNVLGDMSFGEIRKDLDAYDPWLHGEGPDEMPAIDVRPRRSVRFW
jgi:hypothetical protein